VARVRVKGNFQKFIDQFEEMKAAFAPYKGIRIRVINNTPYFIFVNYGTSRMAGRHFIERSAEPIMEIFTQYWHQLPFPFTPENLFEMMQAVKDGAIVELKDRTPVKTGLLSESYEGFVEHY
jgi:hypothetical protein